MKIHTPLPDNSEIEQNHKGQIYKLARVEPYTRKDGSDTTLLVWRSHCPQCGVPFECTTPTAWATFNPNRRCPKHKRPGKRVRTIITIGEGT